MCGGEEEILRGAGKRGHRDTEHGKRGQTAPGRFCPPGSCCSECGWGRTQLLLLSHITIYFPDLRGVRGDYCLLPGVAIIFVLGYFSSN